MVPHLKLGRELLCEENVSERERERERGLACLDEECENAVNHWVLVLWREINELVLVVWNMVIFIGHSRFDDWKQKFL